MADILRVTTPAGQDPTTRVRTTPQEPVNISNLINPNKIPKNDLRGHHEDSETSKFSPNLKSNYDNFMQRVLASGGGMTKELSRLFFTRFGSIVNSNLNEGIAKEMGLFLSMMQVDDAELMALLKGMQNSAVKFTGEFFDILRNLIADKNLPMDGKFIILDFLKRYDSITASNHSLENIMANLKNVADRMMKSSAEELKVLMQEIDRSAGKGDIEANMAVLRYKIIPFLSNYISHTKDFGSVRDNISLFILNFTRYELGSKEGFSEALNSLLSLEGVYSKVNNKMIAEMVDGIFKAAGKTQAIELQDQLVHILTKGLDGQAGYQNTAVFQNILHSALLNESVYMPLLHMMLPIEYAGRQMFSEIWVDPDCKDGDINPEEGQAVKLFVKFDIKDLGFFEMIMLIQSKKVDMQLYYPESLESDKAMIRDSIFNIIERNDLSFRSYMAEKCAEPKPLSDVFKKLSEGRNMINVTV